MKRTKATPKAKKAPVHKVGHAFRRELEVDTHESSDYGLRHVTIRIGHHRIHQFGEILRLASNAVDGRTLDGQALMGLVRDIADGIKEARKKAEVTG